jgi:hypothetical protein
VKLSRYNTDSRQDAAIDDVAFRIYWQARGLLAARELSGRTRGHR